jgi:hypothetical protein
MGACRQIPTLWWNMLLLSYGMKTRRHENLKSQDVNWLRIVSNGRLL